MPQPNDTPQTINTHQWRNRIGRNRVILSKVSIQ